MWVGGGKWVRACMFRLMMDWVVDVRLGDCVIERFRGSGAQGVGSKQRTGLGLTSTTEHYHELYILTISKKSHKPSR